jgi:DNA repair exonuclease SbcCD ATPase subunit
MRRAVARILMSVLVIAAAAAGGAAIGQAQPTPAEPSILPALLVEVRGLRAAMEQMASAGPRVQLALGRVQLQEQRIGNQIRRLDAVRASLAPAQKELDALAERLKGLAEALNEPGIDAETRRGREGEFRALKTEWSRVNTDVQRLSAEETVLVQDIAAEQNRWTEFNQRLEELERALARR